MTRSSRAPRPTSGRRWQISRPTLSTADAARFRAVARGCCLTGTAAADQTAERVQYSTILYSSETPLPRALLCSAAQSVAGLCGALLCFAMLCNVFQCSEVTCIAVL